MVPSDPLSPVMLITAVLLLAALGASKLSYRLGVPGLLLFIAIGMLAGSDGPGGIWFDDARLSQSVGVIALAFILFSGGLETDRRAIRPVLWQGLSLSTLGVAFTALLIGTFAHFILKTTWLEGLLLGAIVSSTDAAAVFSILRSKSVSMKGRTQPLLELESGSNDPMAVLLTVGLIEAISQPDTGPVRLLAILVLQLAVGAVAGYAAGRAALWTLNRFKLESDGLYPAFTIAVVLLTYSGASLLQGNGFLAVYLAGILLGNGDFLHKRSLVRFHDALAWLMQIAMFLVLGLLVFPSQLPPVALPGLLLALFLIFIARPAAVFAALAFAQIRFRQKALVGWVGLRGAVPIILATFPLLAGLPAAGLFFNLVFFIVLTSVLLQGTTIPLVTRLLKLEAPLPTRKQYPLEFVPTTRTTSRMFELELPPDSPAASLRILDLNLPKTALVVLIGRGDTFLAPRGDTRLEPGDALTILAETADQPALCAVLGLSPEDFGE
ncbi:MAG TPA: potassium/proton antiporter [Solibacterales bacterium]|nr:potassium/proton antiporter [Bryobacterales bacterium]